MLASVDNQAIVLAVIGDRYRLPTDRLVPGQVVVEESPHPRLPLRGFTGEGGAVVAVAPDWAGMLRQHLGGPDTVQRAMAAVAAAIPGHLFSGVARTGVAIPPPAAPVTVIDATDPRLPAWVLGHFTGEAWVVLGERGEVLSTAVLKRYDDRLREISVGTAEAARGRGLARSVVYNHDPDNHASARVAESVGLHELGRFHVVVTDRTAGADYSEDDTADERTLPPSTAG
jgi:hypothetical protein